MPSHCGNACPFECECGGRFSFVKDTRPVLYQQGRHERLDQPAYRRRRACDRCGKRITTYEIRVDVTAWEKMVKDAAFARRFDAFITGEIE